MRKLKDNILNFLLYTSSFITVGLLVLIVGFIFVNGIKGINLNYIFNIKYESLKLRNKKRKGKLLDKISKNK